MWQTLPSIENNDRGTAYAIGSKRGLYMESLSACLVYNSSRSRITQGSEYIITILEVLQDIALALRWVLLSMNYQVETGWASQLIDHPKLLCIWNNTITMFGVPRPKFHMISFMFGDKMRLTPNWCPHSEPLNPALLSLGPCMYYWIWQKQG